MADTTKIVDQLDPNTQVDFMNAAGFNFREHPSEAFNLGMGVTLHVGGDSKSTYTFNYLVEDIGLVTQLTFADIGSDQERMSIVNHYDHSFFDHHSQSLSQYELKLNAIARSRILATRLAMQLSQTTLVNELRQAAKEEHDLKIAEDQRRAEKAEQARLQRIANHERTHMRIGETKAIAIIKSMEDDFALLNPQERTTRELLFLLRTGESTHRELHLCNEKGGQMNWRDYRNRMLDPINLIALIAMAWEPKGA